MSPAPKKPEGDEDLTPEEIERAEARADEAFIAEEETKAEQADARETAKETVAEDEAPETAGADADADEAGAAVEAPVAEEVPEPATPEAEGTAAAETGIDKKAAEAITPKRTKRAADRPQGSRRGNRPDQAGVKVSAQAKYVRTSARKARLVCDHIRGKDVEEARAILAFTPRGAAEAWSKLLESAVANAEHNHELVGDELRIFAVHADEGPTLKRFRPRAMGRATKIRKRTSHLTITLTPKD
jgi:ribosomal protein L22